MAGTATSTDTVLPPLKLNENTPLEVDANAGLRDEYMMWNRAQKLERKAASEKKHSFLYEKFCSLHHLGVLVACFCILYLGPAKWPSLPLVAAWWIYSDFYSSLLHCLLDDPRCLNIPGLAPVAAGFQDHHKYPMESTAGKGLRMLCDDTVRIQWIIGCCGVILSGRRDYNTGLMILLKLLTCAYGTQFGHYYAHCVHMAPPIIKALQRVHILLPPAQHWQHHKSPYEQNFGIVNGLTNYHVNPVYLRRTSFASLLVCWIVLTAFDVVLIEEVFHAIA